MDYGQVTLNLLKRYFFKYFEEDKVVVITGGNSGIGYESS